MPQTEPGAIYIYAIYDNVAENIIGGLHLHKHDAAAVRFFTDIATQDGSLINLHPEDYVLLQLGYLTDGIPNLHADKHIIMTGAAWKAAQQPQE